MLHVNARLGCQNRQPDPPLPRNPGRFPGFHGVTFKLTSKMEKKLEDRWAKIFQRQGITGRRLVRAMEGVISRTSRRAIRRMRREHKPDRSLFSVAVERLTNWQRSQWAGRGYPGLREVWLHTLKGTKAPTAHADVVNAYAGEKHA